MFGDRSMSWIDSGDLYGDIILDLVDGYLPRKNMLLRLAKQSSVFAFQGEINPDNWDSDSLYQNLADSVRQCFCARPHKPRVRSKSYCEAWLLRPQTRFGAGFDLKDEDPREDNRRLVLTLHYDCKEGKLCLHNLLTETGFEVIPENCYKDYAAFEKVAKSIFEIASKPFLAPCIVAEHEMEKSGYRCVGFGR